MIETLRDIRALKGWLPVDVMVLDELPVVEWLELPEISFTEPFFNQTIERFKSVSPGTKSIFTEFSALLELEPTLDSLPPSGLIFHSSRCGSTLVANACRKLDGALVISEPPALDKIITRFLTDAEADQTRELLYLLFVRAVASALGQRRSGSERRYFIKFSAPGTLQLQRMRRIWPEVPMLFLYRHPVETIVSNLARLPDWMGRSNERAAAAVAGVSVDELTGMDDAEFCARALGRFYESVPLDDERLLSFNYEDLSGESLLSLIKFFAVSVSPAEQNEILQTIRFYSKDASQGHPFLPDTEFKQASASDHVRSMSNRWALPAYEKLATQQNVATMSR